MQSANRFGWELKAGGNRVDLSFMNLESRLRSGPVLELARRGTVRVAFVAGIGLALVSLVQIAVVRTLGYETLAAALVAVVVSGVMLRQERPNVVALLALIAGSVVVGDSIAAARHATAYVSGVGSEIAVIGIGLLSVFVARSRPWRVATGFLVAAVVIVLIHQATINGWTLEMVSDVGLVVAVVGTVMFFVVRVLQSLAASESRFGDLARTLPVATFEFDVALLMARLRTTARSAESEQPVGEFFAELMPLVRLSYTNRMADAMADQFGMWNEFVDGPNLSQVRQVAGSMVLALLAGETVGSGEVTFARTDGVERDFVYDWSLGRMNGRTEPHRFVLVATDVTRLRHAEHELERQLIERDQFVASVSHELRTPLTAIMGLTEELVRCPEDFRGGEQAELLEIVASETRDVVDIVEDLLVTARAETGQLAMRLELCDLGAEARRVGDVLGSVPTIAQTVWTYADAGRLRQVLRNLVSNAHRHGGGDVRILVHTDGGMAVVEVRDSGPPLPPAASERIFEPYVRADAIGTAGSVGLGLHVARVLARLMGGDLTYDHDGKETIFRLELPSLDEQLDVGVGGEIEEGSRPSDIASIDQV